MVVGGGVVLGASLAAFAIVVIVLAWSAIWRRQVSWRVLLDSPVNQGTTGSRRPETWAISARSLKIEDASLVVLDVHNAGGRPVREADWDVPLRFSFPGREWVAAELVEFEPDTSPSFIPRDLGTRLGRRLDDRLGQRRVSSEILFPPLRLNPRDGFKLLVVLTGDDMDLRAALRPGVQVEGSLRSGRIVQTHNRYAWRSRVALALACALLGVITGLLLAPGGTRHEFSLHLGATWLWPAFVALMSLALAAAGFAVGRWIPPAPAASPVTPWRALGRGYLDALMLPSPPARQARPPIARELADDVRDLVIRLESPPGVRGDR